MHGVNRFCMVLALSAAFDLLLPPCSLQAEDTNTLPMLTPEARDAIEQGLAQFRDNKFDEAEKTFQKVTEMVPNHPMGWINLGSVEYRLGKLDEAENSLRKAVHLEGRNSHADGHCLAIFAAGADPLIQFQIVADH